MRQYLGEQGMVSWVDQILPELIWLAVIIEKLGVKRGVEIGAKIAKIANGILSSEYFAFISSFDLLSAEQKKNLVQLLIDENCFDEVYGSLNPFLQLYPECPLKFLDNQQQYPIQMQTINDFKKILSKYFDRREQPAMIIQTNVVYFAGICGKLHYNSNIHVPNLESIITNFESEGSKLACSGVRATVNGFYGYISKKISDRWPRYFWNRGIQIEPTTPIKREDDEVFQLSDQIRRFIELADLGLEERWNKLPKDIFENYQCEVIGAILARQVTLAKRMARNTAFWNVHIAPIILRVMVDNHIILAWILKDPTTRTKQFVFHGLGQAKLNVEHLKVENEKDNAPEVVKEVIDTWERWINNQQYSFLTNVNLGSWSGMDSRTMAEEADCLDLYRYAYTPFSSCVHNMWDHVGRLNVAQSGNPLHKYMLIPFDPETQPEFDLFLNSAKYLQESFSVVDKTFQLQCSTELPYEYWYNLDQDSSAKPKVDDEGTSDQSSDKA